MTDKELLQAYKDTGMEPEEVAYFLGTTISVKDAKTQYSEYKKRYDEYMAWKRTESEGRLLVLPCKVGTTVYCAAADGVLRGRVIALYIDGNGGMFDLDVYTNVETTAGFQHHICKDYTFEDIGKTVFLTREEAEAALAKGGNK